MSWILERFLRGSGPSSVLLQSLAPSSQFCAAGSPKTPSWAEPRATVEESIVKRLTCPRMEMFRESHLGHPASIFRVSAPRASSAKTGQALPDPNAFRLRSKGRWFSRRDEEGNVHSAAYLGHIRKRIFGITHALNHSSMQNKKA